MAKNDAVELARHWAIEVTDSQWRQLEAIEAEGVKLGLAGQFPAPKTVYEIAVPGLPLVRFLPTGSTLQARAFGKGYCRGRKQAEDNVFGNNTAIAERVLLDSGYQPQVALVDASRKTYKVYIAGNEIPVAEGDADQLVEQVSDWVVRQRQKIAA